MVRLVNRQGSIVAQAELGPASEDGRSFVLSSVRGKRALLQYYCECGLREIWLNLGEVRLSGRLETRWHRARRAWCVRLQGPGKLPGGDNLLEAARVDDGCGHPGQGIQRERCRSFAQGLPAGVGSRSEEPRVATAGRTSIALPR